MSEVGWDLIWELFHFAILSAIVAGLVCPLIGCFLLVRRTGFYGVALPQFAAAGVALGFAMLPWWMVNIGLSGLEYEEAIHSPHAVKNYLLSWAAITTFTGLGALVVLGGQKTTETGRVAASFAIASAATILFWMAAPAGEEFLEELLRGEILVIDLHDFETILIVYGLVLLLLRIFHRELVLVSYDRETALVLGLHVRRLEALMLGLTGLTVSVGVLIVGPIVLFGLLVIPPLAARNLARSMASFFALAALIGVLSAVVGVWVSFFLDWPLGPTMVMVSSLGLVVAWLFGRAGRVELG